ncbi:hypothetical protein B4U80_13582 [Leptotrombidium deliense]|uniref:Uncharacterized protein n=1 Tax=Leptotrombidium deliense TaxID=299467 RepID=A0A443SWX2_9ACAR|nr:hypothetical protein B4U80_13582 [Leptotrombidium deliense]
MNQANHAYGNYSVNNSWNQLWNQGCVNLLTDRNIRTNTVDAEKEEATCNCSNDVMRCTLRKVPESASLLQKCRLPFGILIHPFKDEVGSASNSR